MIAASTTPGRTLLFSPLEIRRASRLFQAQNKTNGSHSQLVLNGPRLICPMLKVKKAQLIIKPSTQVVKKMVKPRHSCLNHICPEPGTIRENSQAGA